MNIQKINFLSNTQYNTDTQKTAANRLLPRANTGDIEYRPYAYRDFNINFGERLFRTPSNFYEQPFNQNGMPYSLKEYLNEDYSDRQNIPPAQMMKIVFGDIENAESLEEVKDMYPEEPLFQNLHSLSDKKYREGVLADIKIMQDEGFPLFKNGDNDLGMYILKKIYVEGKTLKEINKDFKKDISREFEGISDIDYKTLKSFGIHFPNRAFWKSFIATREDFPYTYTPRKAVTSRTSTSIHNNSRSVRTSDEKIDKRPPKYNPKDYEVKKITDAILEGQGDKTTVQKKLKKNLGSKNETFDFINQYFSEIQSIALENIHASEVMSEFFENYDGTSKSQRQKLQEYWNNNPDMKSLFSKSLSDTIKLFFLSYGADGNNEYFRDLLEYAHSIKPEREERKRLHDELQDEYERTLGIIKPQEDNDTNEIKNEPAEEISQDIHNKYVFEINGTNIIMKKEPQKYYSEFLKSNYGNLYPDKFLSKYIQYTQKSPQADDKYYLSKYMSGKKIDIPGLEDKLYEITDLEKIDDNIEKTFAEKYRKENYAAQQALMNILYKTGVTDDNLYLMYKTSPLSLFLKRTNSDSASDINTAVKSERGELNAFYEEYIKPVRDSEANKIVLTISDKLRNYDSGKSILYSENSGYPDASAIDYMAMAAELLTGKNAVKKEFRNKLTKFIINEYGGSARLIIDKNSPDNMKMAKAEQILSTYMKYHPSEFRDFLLKSQTASDMLLIHLRDKNPIEYLKYKNILAQYNMNDI